MMKIRLEAVYRGKSIKFSLLETGLFNKFRGLMFSRPKNLLFSFNSGKIISIHSYFVFYDFLAIWVKDGKVIEQRIVKPFSFVTPKSRFDELIEIPLTLQNREIIEFFVGKKKDLNIRLVKR